MTDNATLAPSEIEIRTEIDLCSVLDRIAYIIVIKYNIIRHIGREEPRPISAQDNVVVEVNQLTTSRLEITSIECKSAWGHSSHFEVTVNIQRLLDSLSEFKSLSALQNIHIILLERELVFVQIVGATSTSVLLMSHEHFYQ